MAEFSQHGAIVTLHRLGSEHASTIETQLEEFARTRPIALVLPCLFDELSRPALKNIVNDLRHIRYLHRIVVSLGKAPPDGMQIAQRFFSPLPQNVSFVWNDGPRLEALYQRLAREGFTAGCAGKGGAVWIGCGYLLARGDVDVVAVHDCDIKTYTAELLARLCVPIVHPELGFRFAKGYYARLGSGEMYGRVTRLFVAPLVRAAQAVLGPSPILTYLESFHYPLAGEVAMTADVARLIRMPADWGLEIGMLTEVYRQCGLDGVCQTELCTQYDHKHQQLGDDCETGLLKMCVDIARSLLNTLADEGLDLPAERWRDLVAAYRRAADELVSRYHADAAVNGLRFAFTREDALVESFASALKTACERHSGHVLRIPPLPSWARINAALPQFGDWLREAVELDSREAAGLSYGLHVAASDAASGLP